MSFTTLIQANELHTLLQTAATKPVICDCRFDLANPEAGSAAHAAGHIPGAAYLHLERMLSGAKTGRNGRHPLPDRDTFAAAMASLGAAPGSQIIAYDAAEGMFAARLWWLMRWLGHGQVALLDGGFTAWQRGGYMTEHVPPSTPEPGTFVARPSLVTTVGYLNLRAGARTNKHLIVDARAPDRFRGENETLDTTGGHIPGARNRFFRDNTDPLGRFKPAPDLAADFAALLAGQPAATVVSQCGSGVTACHNLLAMEIAGLSGASLYPGSWSEWSAQPDAPVATGPA